MTDLPDEEKEEYILTPEEEKKVIENAIESAQRRFIWKRFQINESQVQIDAKMATIDWHKEINRKRVLYIANSLKHRQIEQDLMNKERKANEIKELEALKLRCTSKYMFDGMCRVSLNEFGEKFIVDDDNKAMIKALCLFLSRDPRFETELGFSFKKGLWFKGLQGRGKTYPIKCARGNELNPIKIISTIDATESLKETGRFDIGPYKMLYIDDVGTEELDTKNYGSKINFFKLFIERIYLEQNDFGNLMITTNCPFKEIEDRYGLRVSSRIKDMFNIITVKGIDRRGKKFQKEINESK